MKNKILIIMVCIFLLNIFFVVGNNESNYDGYIWYDKFDSISVWDFNSPITGDQTLSPEFKITNFDGDNRLHDFVTGISGVELERADLNLKDLPLCGGYEYYATNSETYDYLQSNSGAWRYQHYHRTGIDGDDTRVSEYTSGSAVHTLYDYDYLNQTWYNITICWNELNTVYYVNNITTINVSNVGIMNQQNLDVHLNFRGDGLDSYFDNFKLYYGNSPLDEPIKIDNFPEILEVNLTTPLNDTTPTFNILTLASGLCSISDDNITLTQCENTGSTFHICTLPLSQKLINCGEDIVYFTCVNNTQEDYYIYEIDIDLCPTESTTPNVINITSGNETNYIMYFFILWVGILFFALKLNDVSTTPYLLILNGVMGIFFSLWMFNNIDDFPRIITAIFGLLNGFLFMIAFIKK